MTKTAKEKEFERRFERIESNIESIIGILKDGKTTAHNIPKFFSIKFNNITFVVKIPTNKAIRFTINNRATVNNAIKYNTPKRCELYY